jgi:hypothetical protein
MSGHSVDIVLPLPEKNPIRASRGARAPKVHFRSARGSAALKRVWNQEFLATIIFVKKIREKPPWPKRR